MKHKILTLLAAATILFSGAGVSVIASSQPVHAVSKFSYHWHWARTNRRVRVYRVIVGKYMYLSKVRHVKTLPRGRRFQIRYTGHDYPWYVRRFGYGHRGTFVVLRNDSHWFRNAR